ncbi:MAG: RnfABCDGE type electron transport complex subunit G [Candidatus Omnitrophica bacterium]|nr:RnfABCDGE type electron transport complex subunit G [Candidatus Omnitrophota bacterium]
MIKFGVILMAICFIASLVLALVYQITQPVIASQRSREELALLKEVLPTANKFKVITNQGEEYFEGSNRGRTVGYIIRANSRGYSGDIKILVGIAIDGKIKGVQVLEHTETPGLGARITEVKSGEKHPWFLEQFKEKRIEELNFKNVQAITGATVSSKAVLEGVKKEAEEFLKSKR